MNIRVSIIVFICLIAFSFGCAENVIKNDTPKENNTTQMPSEVKEITQSSNTQLPSRYVACGCGCCGQTKPIKQCLYRKRGDDLQKIINDDRTQAKSSDCPKVGCSQGIEYRYFD